MPKTSSMISASNYRAITTYSSSSTNRKTSSCGPAKVRADHPSSSWSQTSTRPRNWSWPAIASSTVVHSFPSMATSKLQCIPDSSKKCCSKYSTRLKTIPKASPSSTMSSPSTSMTAVFGSGPTKSWTSTKRSSQRRMTSTSLYWLRLALAWLYSRSKSSTILSEERPFGKTKVSLHRISWGQRDSATISGKETRRRRGRVERRSWGEKQSMRMSTWTGHSSETCCWRVSGWVSNESIVVS